jgi:hypothetical protein
MHKSECLGQLEDALDEPYFEVDGADAATVTHSNHVPLVRVHLDLDKTSTIEI